MSVTWTRNIPIDIMGRIKSEFSQSMKKKYKMTDDHFTRKSKEAKEALLPFVYMEESGGSSAAKDLERNNINGIKDYTLRFYITAKKKETAEDIAYEIQRIMTTKTLFECSKPIEQKTNNSTYSYVVQCDIKEIDEFDII